MSKSKFSQPTGRSNALDAVQTSYNDPLEVPFRSLKEGEGIVVRFLSLSDDHIVRQQGVRASVENTKPGATEKYFKTWVPLPKNADDADSIEDDEGVTLSDHDLKEVWFVPVLTLYTVDKDGFKVDDINELQYLKMGPGMVKDIKTLSENVKDDFEFESIPPYDIRIEAFKNGTIPNWSLNPVTKILKKEKGKTVKETCPRFGVELLEDALGKEVWDYIVDNIHEIIEHYTEIDEKERKVEAIKKRFVRYRSTSNNNATSTRSVGMKRDLPVAEDEPEDDGGEADEPTEESKPSFRGLGKGRFGK